MQALAIRNDSLKGIQLVLTILALLLVGILAYSQSIVEYRYTALWTVFYVLGGIYTFTKLYKGLIFHPFVLLGSAYVLLLVIGAFIYEQYKPIPLKDFPFNLIGIGYAALFLGTVLGESLSMQWTDLTYNKHPHNVRLIYGLIAFAILVNMFLFAKFGGAPLFAAKANIAKVAFQKGNGIPNLFYMALPVFSLFILYDSHHKKRSLWWSHAFLVLVMAIILLRGYRSNTLICIGEYLSLYILLKQKKFSLKWMLVGFLAVVVFVSALGAFRRDDDSKGLDATLKEFYIVTTHRPAMVAIIARNFTEDQYYHGSLYYTDFKKFLPGAQHHANVDFKYAVFSKDDTDSDKMDDTAGVTPSLIGESYMNFGQVGAFWVLLILGFVLIRLYKLFLSKPSFLVSGAYLTLAFNLSGSMQSGLGLKFVHLSQILFFVVLIGFFYNFKLKNGNKELFS